MFAYIKKLFHEFILQEAVMRKVVGFSSMTLNSYNKKSAKCVGGKYYVLC